MKHEATLTIQEAINEFKGTSEETRVSVANVDLLLGRGDTDNALNLLKKIESTMPYYIEAREKMANIYLNFRKDKRLYLATYKSEKILLYFCILKFIENKFMFSFNKESWLKSFKIRIR